MRSDPNVLVAAALSLIRPVKTIENLLMGLR
jgi:hypothetical protein